MNMGRVGGVMELEEGTGCKNEWVDKMGGVKGRIKGGGRRCGEWVV